MGQKLSALCLEILLYHRGSNYLQIEYSSEKFFTSHVLTFTFLEIVYYWTRIESKVLHV